MKENVSARAISVVELATAPKGQTYQDSGFCLAVSSISSLRGPSI